MPTPAGPTRRTACGAPAEHRRNGGNRRRLPARAEAAGLPRHDPHAPAAVGRECPIRTRTRPFGASRVASEPRRRRRPRAPLRRLRVRRQPSAWTGSSPQRGAAFAEGRAGFAAGASASTAGAASTSASANRRPSRLGGASDVTLLVRGRGAGDVLRGRSATAPGGRRGGLRAGCLGLGPRLVRLAVGAPARGAGRRRELRTQHRLDLRRDLAPRLVTGRARGGADGGAERLAIAAIDAVGRGRSVRRGRCRLKSAPGRPARAAGSATGCSRVRRPYRSRSTAAAYAPPRPGPRRPRMPLRALSPLAPLGNQVLGDRPARRSPRRHDGRRQRVGLPVAPRSGNPRPSRRRGAARAGWGRHLLHIVESTSTTGADRTPSRPHLRGASTKAPSSRPRPRPRPRPPRRRRRRRPSLRGHVVATLASRPHSARAPRGPRRHSASSGSTLAGGHGGARQLLAGQGDDHAGGLARPSARPA